MTKAAPKFEIAKRYARALFDDALEKNVLEEVLKNLKDFCSALKENADLEKVFTSQSFRPAEKAAALADVAKHLKMTKSVTNLLALLAEKGRLASFEKIKDVFESMLLAHQGVLSITVATARPLDDRLLKKLNGVLKAAFKKEILLTQAVDPDLIGGMTLKAGSLMYDGSVSAQLKKLQIAMKGA